MYIETRGIRPVLRIQCKFYSQNHEIGKSDLYYITRRSPYFGSRYFLCDFTFVSLDDVVDFFYGQVR